MQEAFDNCIKSYGFGEAQYKKLEDALKAQGLEIKALKETGNVATKSLADVLKEHLTEENINKLKSNNIEHIGIEAKAAATITTANAALAPHALTYEVVPGIQEAPFEQPVILTSLNKGKTNSRTIFWINRINEDGGSAFIAEGALKPLKDWDYKEENSVAKKVAVLTKVSSETLNDFEYMLSEIRMLLTRDLYRVVDEKLLNGSAAADPAGIIPGAGGYIGTGVDGAVTLPNDADAIRAAMLQMRMINYKPDVVFTNRNIL
jgi:HK97 family phage major capsid protein